MQLEATNLVSSSAFVQGGEELESVLSERLRQLPAPLPAEQPPESAVLGIGQTLEPEVPVSHYTKCMHSHTHQCCRCHHDACSYPAVDVAFL